jgi:flagellar biosynthesis protein FlhB
MSEQEQNRSEAATPFKLKEAQQRGQVAKSQEAVFAAILGGVVLALFASGEALSREVLAMARDLFLETGRSDWSQEGLLAWAKAASLQGLRALAPLLLAVLVAAVVANFAQVGAVFSAKPITPDFDRINPASGLKRLFSLKLVYEGFKSTLKLAALAYVLWLALEALLPGLLRLLHIEARAHALVVGPDVPRLLVKLLLVLLAIALLDVGYTRWDFAKRMRMSRREVTEEHKQREGDPRIRSRLRQLRLDMLKQSRAMRALPGADVLLTNPTHLAVAISYKHGQMPAPKLLAKGAGELAAKMREVARQHRIPVIENRPLARALYKRLASDQYVPEDLYPDLARILLWVYARRAQGAGGAA